MALVDRVGGGVEVAEAAGKKMTLLLPWRSDRTGVWLQTIAKTTQNLKIAGTLTMPHAAEAPEVAADDVMAAGVAETYQSGVH